MNIFFGLFMCVLFHTDTDSNRSKCNLPGRKISTGDNEEVAAAPRSGRLKMGKAGKGFRPWQCKVCAYLICTSLANETQPPRVQLVTLPLDAST